MHPAPSVIVFSSLSGAGLGLFFFLGLGVLVPTGWVAFWLFAVAYGLTVGGLVASTLHLGHPERAWLAFTQWRSSWLSREGIAAVATLLVMAAYAIGLIFFGTRLTVIGWIGAVLAAGTVLTTAMIYAQLKSVPRWHHPATVALFLSCALAGGAVLIGLDWGAIAALLLAAGVMVVWWVQGDGRFAASGTTVQTATGLRHGAVRLFSPPHTGQNYLLREMVFQVGRRHAAPLRVLALVLGFGLPVLILLLPLGLLGIALAFISHLAGVLASRWLFFAQAEHVVGLYYGRSGA
jgi:sulfite dehydrogenase (quinone) subunit SoeC